jgi:hypothetical protein
MATREDGSLAGIASPPPLGRPQGNSSLRLCGLCVQRDLSRFRDGLLQATESPEQLNGQRISATFFPTLGILPARGRNFTEEEDAPHGPAVCIISHELWRTRFGGREQVVGENLTLDGQPWQVVGIMPPRLSPPFSQIFAPRVFEVGGLTPVQIKNGAGYAQPIARLRPGVSLEQAKVDEEGLAHGSSFFVRLRAFVISRRQEAGSRGDWPAGTIMFASR